MSAFRPRKVLISEGREIGGVGRFAEALGAGFSQRGMPVEILRPSQVLRRWRELRDPSVLKILSTTAVFAAPVARRAICMAHGFPRADAQGWRKVFAILTSLKMASWFSGCQLVAVSHYVALHLRSIFKLRIDAVVFNPLAPIFLESVHPESCQSREYITYVGRLIPAKNLHRLLPAVRLLLDENPGMRMCIIGDGAMRPELQRLVAGDARFEFCGTRDPLFIRDRLRQTKLFVSGCETEALGIAYLEALTQGCNIAMPACGGGLEISPENMGTSIHVLPLSWDHGQVLSVLRNALLAEFRPIAVEEFSAEAAASRFLTIGARFSRRGLMESAGRAELAEGSQ